MYLNSPIDIANALQVLGELVVGVFEVNTVVGFRHLVGKNENKWMEVV